MSNSQIITEFAYTVCTFCVTTLIEFVVELRGMLSHNCIIILILLTALVFYFTHDEWEDDRR